MARSRKLAGELDLDLEDLPALARWREWMGRVEAVIFASAEPVLGDPQKQVNRVDGFNLWCLFRGFRLVWPAAISY